MGSSSSTLHGSQGTKPVISSSFLLHEKEENEDKIAQQSPSLSSSGVIQSTNEIPTSNYQKNSASTEDLLQEEGISKSVWPITTPKEAGKALKSLVLTSHDFRTAKKIVKENPELLQYLKTALECVLYISDSTCPMYLENLNLEFFNMQMKDRVIVGDFLSYVKFAELSYNRYKEVLNSLETAHFHDKLYNDEDKDHQSSLQCAVSIRSHWWNYSDASTCFAAELADAGIMEELVKDTVNLIGTDGKILKNSFSFESSIGTLHNLAKLPNLRQKFRDLKVVDVLGNFLTYQEHPKLTMLVLMTLSLIIDDNQTHLLISHDSVLDLLLLIANRALKSSDHRHDGFSIEEVLVSLAGLSRNDQVKNVLVQKGVLTLVLDVLTSGNDTEKEVAAKLLWELSFDPDNKVLIEQNETLMKTLTELSKCSNKFTAWATEGVLWVLGMGKRKKKKEKKIAAAKVETTGSTGHIMISYNWSDQKKLFEIRDVLRSNGYKIWMDIDNISGSTLQAMAEAVEQADVVLVCMSEKYKESPNCRSEAEYAFSLQKPIIPLLMQLDYKPDGWLGILVGTKIFFNFSGKYSFESKMAELVKEIGNRGKHSSGPGQQQDETDGPIVREVGAVVGKAPNPQPAPQFTIANWIKENNLERFSCLKTLTAEQLQFLKKISQRAPEFYYSFMSNFLAGRVTLDNLSGLMEVTGAVEKIAK